MCCTTSRAKYFMMMGVSATGLYSLKQAVEAFFGTGMMVVLLKQMGNPAWLREVLKMSVRTSVSSSSQSFST